MIHHISDSVMISISAALGTGFQNVCGASAPTAGPTIIRGYLRRHGEEVNRPTSVLGSRRCRTQRCDQS